MKKKAFTTKRIAYIALFTAFAMILSYVESLIPIYFGAPGIKLGLANFFLLLLVRYKRNLDAVIVNVLRIALGGFLFGNLYSILFSLAGGMFSLGIMILFEKFRFHVLCVSIAGAVSHNIAQVFVAYLVMESFGIWYYLPVLLLAGVITGLAIGVLNKSLKPHLDLFFR